MGGFEDPFPAADDSSSDPQHPTLTEEQELQRQELVAAFLQTLDPVTLTTEDEESITLSCPCCSFLTTEKDELEVHALEHQDCVFSCKHCPFSSDRWGKYSRHMSKHNIGDKTYTCPSCNYRTKTKGSYDAHMRTHTGEKPYSCSFCPYRSSQRVHLKIHVRTHTGEKPFACPHCPYQATQNSSLKRHVQTQHPATPKLSRRYNKYTSGATSGPLPGQHQALLYSRPYEGLPLVMQQQHQQTAFAQQHFRQLLQQQLQQLLVANTVTTASVVQELPRPGTQRVLEVQEEESVAIDEVGAEGGREEVVEEVKTAKSLADATEKMEDTVGDVNKSNDVIEEVIKLNDGISGDENAEDELDEDHVPKAVSTVTDGKIEEAIIVATLANINIDSPAKLKRSDHKKPGVGLKSLETRKREKLEMAKHQKKHLMKKVPKDAKIVELKADSSSTSNGTN